MRNQVERLRGWLLGSAIFLVLVIAAFIGSARYIRHRLLATLPQKLGIDVTSDANGVTFSHANGGRTDYVLHAARKEEHTNGKIALHGVSIALYGKLGTRRDRIAGDEFEYDPKAGVLRALGVVHIDLQAADGAGGTGAGSKDGKATQGTPEARVMHVTTSGLVYLEKLGVAATSEYIEFESGGWKGHATGADYASDTGMLMLHSAVSMSGVAGGRPVALNAATANYDDRSQQIFLTGAKYASAGRTAEAQQATLHRRPDGTLSRVEAQGNVTLGANGATMVAQRADAELTAASEPRTAVLTGGVRYSVDQPLRQMRGQADAATIVFDGQAKPQPEDAVFTGAAHLTERTRATDAAKEPWSTRELTAAKIEAALVRAGKGQSEVRDAEATGSPHMTTVNNGSLASMKGAGTTELSADDLKAHFLAGDGKQAPQVDTIGGRGHAVLRQMGMDGVEQVSSADALDAKFRPKAGAKAGMAGPDTLLGAVEQGHVTMMRRAPAKSGAKPHEDVEHAVADRAVYGGDQDRMTLTGGAQVSDAGSMLWANQVVMDRGTGDAHAVGGVKVNYVEDDSAKAARAVAARGALPAEATHVLADRADLDHATDIATFYGKPVRLWQGGSQVEAPVIEFARAQQRLIARGEAGTGWSAAQQAAQVRTVLARTGSDSGAAAKAGTAKSGTVACATPVAGKTSSGVTAGARSANVLRVASGGLMYSGILRQADFTGGFRADGVDGTVRANAGTVYLQPPTSSPTHDDKTVVNGVPGLGGELDHVIAAGHVELDKPGLHATGERLVYTANDQVFLLTGDGTTPPKAVDAQGTTTGAALRLQSSCDGSGGVSVEVLGTVPGSPAQRVRTDSQIRNDAVKGKAKP